MGKSLSYYAAFCVGKLMIHGMHMLKRNATNLPGETALMICPNMLSYFKMPETVIVVTGTNGKTTVTNLIGSVLKKSGREIMTNALGGNVDTGICSLLIEQAKMDGSLKKNTLLLEMDERSAKRILPYVQPDYLVCTNLQRDSMKRNAHVEFIFQMVNGNIPKKTKLILNADDLVSNQLAPENERVHFGVAPLEGRPPVTDSLVRDLRCCPKCGRELEYDYLHYNHIGKAHCPACGFKSPDADYLVTAADKQLEIRHGDGTERYPIVQSRMTDIFNTAAAVALLRTLGLSEEEIGEHLKHTEIVKSRYEIIRSHGKEVHISLAKGQNPIAVSGVFDFTRKEPGKKAVILILEDAFDRTTTSENIAWLYETDFEFLKDDSIVKILVGGDREKDFLVRLLLAGVDRDKIITSRDCGSLVPQLEWDSFDKLMVLYDMYNTKELRQIREQLAEGDAI